MDETAPEPPVAAPTPDEMVATDRSLSLEQFDHDDAWQLGTTIARLAAERRLTLAAAVWIGDQRVFHHARPGTSADNDGWMDRKQALVRHYDAPSLLTAVRLGEHGITVPERWLGLDPARHAIAGGGVPIRVRGTTVGVLTVSGLTDAEDHALAVEALTLLRDVQPTITRTERTTA